MAKKAVKKVKPKAKRMSEGVQDCWQVWCLYVRYNSHLPEKHHTLNCDFKTEKQAQAYVKKNPQLVAPVIRHVEIPPMEY